MIFIKLILILFLIHLSYENQCPSSDYCTCSPDLTIIKCTNRQLTNELLFNINNQLPRSTILLNLSSNILTSVEFLLNLNHLEILDLSFNKIHYLPSDFLSRFPHLTSLYLQNNSLQILPKTFRASSTVHLDLSNNPFHCTCQSKWYQSNSQLKNLLCQNQKPFHENDFCRTNQLFSMTPHKSQIAYENEPFLLNCSSNSKRYWTLNEKHYPSTITSSSYSTIIIDHLQMKHSGIWTCHYLNLNHSISLTILPSLVEQFCPSIRMNTSKGLFHWPRTLINNKIERKCPFGSAAWLRNSNEDARAWYTCSSNGNWMHLDLAQCAFQSNISRIFDYLSLTETNLLLRLIKYLSKLDKNLFDLNDMILLIDLIDEQQNKYQNQDRVTLIFHLTDFILQIKHNFTYSREYQMAITRLRFIIERLVDLTEQPWVYIGKELTAMSIQAPLTSTLCLIPNRSLLTILCEPDNRQHYESPLATIHFPPSSNRTTQKSLYQVIFYRQSILYVPNEKKTLINNPVLYIRPVSRYSSSPVGLTFYNPVNQASIGIWYSNQTTWQLQSSVCKINEQNSNLISTYCVLFNNNSLALTYLNDVDQHENGFFNKKYSQLTIYISSILASSCFLVSIVCYICFSKIYQMPRRFFHCLINYWLNLTILIPLFAFGIQQIHYPILCELISTSLHFLCLTTILWLTLLTFLIWRKFHGMLTHNDYQRKPPVIMVDYDDDVSLPIVKLKPKSIVQLYLFVYGIGFLICGIDMIVSREEYIIKTICFSKHFDSILLLIIPIFIFIFFSLILLLITRHYIKHLTEKQISRRNCSDQTILHSENLLPSRRNKVLPIFVPSNLNPYHSPSEDSYLSDTDYQYESINQLLSILCQFILLILLFLSSSTIYLQPLHSFKLRFEYIIYSHLYGFFVLFLAFYILSYHILSRSNLIKRYYFHRNNEHNLRKEFYRERPISSAIKHFDLSSCTEQVSLLPSTHACYLSNRDICQIPQQTERTTIYNEHMYDSKPIVKVASEHYALHRHISKTNSSEHAPLFSALDVIAHRNTNRYRPQRNSLYERSLKRSTYYPIESHILQDKNTHLSSSSFPSCQSFTYPRISPCQAIIRPIPITRLSTLNAINNLSNSTHILQSNTNRNSLLDENHLTTNKRRSFHLISSSSHDDYQSAYASLNKLDYSIQQESSDDNSSSQKNSAYQCIQVEYIDEMEDGSVSLKQSICDSKESLDSLSTKKSNSPTIVSSSLDSENDIFIVNQLPLHESIV
ncbi:hypothetical protein I4U23_021037 [Adineta vaga]|nr:hypothetical protein I4U23_021037 [Adineta vaga]